MKPIVDILEKLVGNAIAEATGEAAPGIVKPTQDAKFGDYQANGVMGLAKKRKQNPRQLAEKIIGQLDVSDLCEPPAIAGPGFINFRLKPDWLAERLSEAIKDHKRLGVEPVTNPPRTVVDFSSPNIAKQMHVGHLRSTIIGDVIARVLEFWYDDEDTPRDDAHKKVIRQNHVGDWGTQFGRVILGLWHLCMAKKHELEGTTNYIHHELPELQVLVHDKQKQKELCQAIRDRHEKDWRDDSIDEDVDGKKRFKPFLDKVKELIDWQDIIEAYQYVNLLEESVNGMGLEIPTFDREEKQEKYISYESLSRKVTAMLQIGGEKNRQEYDAWKYVTEISLDHCNSIYEKLSVKLDNNDVYGESEYNDLLPGVISALSANSAVDIRKSEGANCVFMSGFKAKDGEPLPLIVQKSDGAYLYATTDLAAIRYRVGELKAERIVYVTDARQKLHFEMVFTCVRQAGWVGKNIQLEHVPFGSVLDKTGKPFKTRSGENVKLEGLLEEAVARARRVVQEKNPDLPSDKKDEIANAVGIGAVKYADLSNNLVSDYVFDWDKMLAMDGNTAPYMQYAYARVQSIFRKGDINPDDLLAQDHALELTESEELTLAKLLLRYGEIVETVARDLRPHLLTGYLYDLAQAFSGFYTNCPVLKAQGNTRSTRLLLCFQTAQTIRHGLDLLGIQTIEQM